MHTIWWNSKNNAYALNKVNDVKEFEDDINQQDNWRFITTINASTFEKIMEEFTKITKMHKDIIRNIVN